MGMVEFIPFRCRYYEEEVVVNQLLKRGGFFEEQKEKCATLSEKDSTPMLVLNKMVSAQC